MISGTRSHGTALNIFLERGTVEVPCFALVHHYSDFVSRLPARTFTVPEAYGVMCKKSRWHTWILDDSGTPDVWWHMYDNCQDLYVNTGIRNRSVNVNHTLYMYCIYNYINIHIGMLPKSLTVTTTRDPNKPWFATVTGTGSIPNILRYDHRSICI